MILAKRAKTTSHRRYAISSIQGFQQFGDDGVVEQAPAKRGDGMMMLNGDQAVMLQLTPCGFGDGIAEPCDVKALSNTQTEHDGLFEILLDGDVLAASPRDPAFADGATPQARMCDVPGTQGRRAVLSIGLASPGGSSLGKGGCIVMGMRPGSESGPVDVAPVAEVMP